MQSVQLELQGAVELEQALPVGDSPPGKKGSWWGTRRGQQRAGTEVGSKSLGEAHTTGPETRQAHRVIQETADMPCAPLAHSGAYSLQCRP